MAPCKVFCQVPWPVKARVAVGGRPSRHLARSEMQHCEVCCPCTLKLLAVLALWDYLPCSLSCCNLLTGCQQKCSLHGPQEVPFDRLVHIHHHLSLWHSEALAQHQLRDRHHSGCPSPFAGPSAQGLSALKLHCNVWQALLSIACSHLLQLSLVPRVLAPCPICTLAGGRFPAGIPKLATHTAYQ